MTEAVCVVVTGSRTWDDEAAIRRALERTRDALGRFVLVEGGAPGADTIAHEVALSMGIMVIRLGADWTLGRKAGPLRNTEMLTKYKPERVLAFWDGRSRGTWDCITQAVRMGLDVWITAKRREAA